MRSSQCLLGRLVTMRGRQAGSAELHWLSIIITRVDARGTKARSQRERLGVGAHNTKRVAPVAWTHSIEDGSGNRQLPILPLRPDPANHMPRPPDHSTMIG